MCCNSSTLQMERRVDDGCGGKGGHTRVDGFDDAEEANENTHSGEAIVVNGGHLKHDGPIE